MQPLIIVLLSTLQALLPAAIPKILADFAMIKAINFNGA